MLHVADERKQEEYRRMKEITNERAETEEIFANTGPYHHTTNQNIFSNFFPKDVLLTIAQPRQQHEGSVSNDDHYVYLLFCF